MRHAAAHFRGWHVVDNWIRMRRTRIRAALFRSTVRDQRARFVTESDLYVQRSVGVALRIDGERDLLPKKLRLWRLREEGCERTPCFVGSGVRTDAQCLVNTLTLKEGIQCVLCVECVHWATFVLIGLQERLARDPM